jgi:hypothetical protein
MAKATIPRAATLSNHIATNHVARNANDALRSLLSGETGKK